MPGKERDPGRKGAGHPPGQGVEGPPERAGRPPGKEPETRPDKCRTRARKGPGGFLGVGPGKPPGYWPNWVMAQPSFSDTFSGTDELLVARSAAWAALTPARASSSDG